MADPILVDIPKNAWLKVATAVTSGMIHIKNSTPVYYQTYRDTGGAAPVGLTEIVRLAEMSGGSAEIASTSPIDVYIYALDYDGKIRLDL